jgi:hypothetical protein
VLYLLIIDSCCFSACAPSLLFIVDVGPEPSAASESEEGAEDNDDNDDAGDGGG